MLDAKFPLPPCCQTEIDDCSEQGLSSYLMFPDFSVLIRYAAQTNTTKQYTSDTFHTMEQ